MSPGPATPRDVVAVERNRAESDSAEKRATSGGQRKGPSGERRCGGAPPPGRSLESGLCPPEGPWNRGSALWKAPGTREMSTEGGAGERIVCGAAGSAAGRRAGRS